MKAGSVYLSSAWFRAVVCFYGCIAVIGECVHGVQRLRFVADDCHHFYCRIVIIFIVIVIVIVVLVIIILVSWSLPT